VHFTRRYLRSSPKSEITLTVPEQALEVEGSVPARAIPSCEGRAPRRGAARDGGAGAAAVPHPAAPTPSGVQGLTWSWVSLAWLRGYFFSLSFFYSLQYIVGLLTLLEKVGMGLVTVVRQPHRTLEPCSVHGVCLGVLLAASPCGSLVHRGTGLPKAMITKANLRWCCCLWLWALDLPAFRSWARISQHALLQPLSYQHHLPSILPPSGTDKHRLNLGIQRLLFFCETLWFHFYFWKGDAAKPLMALGSLRRTCPAGSEFFGLSQQHSHTVDSIGTNSPFLELISSTWLSSPVCEEFLFECTLHLYK